MDDAVIRQTIKNVFDEPCAPEELVQAVVARARAVTLGREAQEKLKTAPPEACRELMRQLVKEAAETEVRQPRQAVQKKQGPAL